MAWARSPIAVVAAAAAASFAPGVASASPGSGPTAAVALGDSYISGEGGRWLGNSNVRDGSHGGTDRAWVPTDHVPRRFRAYRNRRGYVDVGRVYEAPSDANGCHRSDVAPIRTARLFGIDEAVNLACSGATTEHVLRSASGGRSHRGEGPQADRLAAVARSHDVKVITVMVGGNDLHFGSIVTDCVKRFALAMFYDECHEAQSGAIADRFPPMLSGVARTLADVHAVMAEAGYARRDYDLILMGYPAPLPSSARMRYGDVGRLVEGGCLFSDGDLDMGAALVGRLAEGLRTVARAGDARFLDLRHAFYGRELCADGVSLVDGDERPSGSDHEWVRFITTGLFGHGSINESLHPNAFGQRALGACLKGMRAFPRPEEAFCVNRPGQGPESMRMGRDMDLVDRPPVCDDHSDRFVNPVAGVRRRLTLACRGVIAGPITVVDGPRYGTLEPVAGGSGALLTEEGAVDYVPRRGFDGTDTFTFRASGPNGTSEIATVTIDVVATPVCRDQRMSVELERFAFVTVACSGRIDRYEVVGPGDGGDELKGWVQLNADGRGNIVAWEDTAFTYRAVGPGGASAPARVDVDVSGSSRGAVPTASRDRVEFGAVTVATASDEQVVTLSNTGHGPLTWGAASLTGAHAGDFAIAGSQCGAGKVLPPGGSCVVRLRFRPGAPGARQAVLSIGVGPWRPPLTVALEGAGLPPFAEDDEPDEDADEPDEDADDADDEDADDADDEDADDTDDDADDDADDADDDADDHDDDAAGSPAG